MYRIVFPRGYRPQFVHACRACTDRALASVHAASASPVDAARLNQSYACDLHYEGCARPSGSKRYT